MLAAERFSYWYPADAAAVSPAAPALSGAALKDVSLRFTAGEFVLVIGPSGCGKSTLIQALLGAVPALTGGMVSGRVTLEDVPILAGGLPAVAGRVGVILQDPESQLTNLDVEGEVVFGPENLGLPRATIAERLEASLAATKIAHLRNRFVYALSGGQKQRVAIAAALAMHPRILLLDSPTSNLDPLGSEETLHAIVGLWQAGAVDLIVMAAHKIDDVLPFATRLVVLDGGRVVHDGPPAAVLGGHADHLREGLGVFVPEVCELAELAAARSAAGGMMDPGRGHIGANEDAGPPTSVPEVAALLAVLPPPRAPLPVRRVKADRAPGGNSSSAVEVRDLHFAYESGGPVLSGVSLSVDRGEFLALLGQNGTGKTTLAKCIAGLYRASWGTIRVAGMDVSSGAALLRSGTVGYVFQHPDHQFVTRTVYDEIAYGLRVRRAPETEMAPRVEAMLARFGLQARRDSPPYRLSMGEKRRLSVATMLVLQPEVLILDEPTTGLDRQNMVTLMDVLRQEAAERGLTIIQITHDMEQAARYADRAVVMDGGEVVFDGALAGLFVQDELLRRCHLKPTPTAAAARIAWPQLEYAPTTPDELAAALAVAPHTLQEA